MSIKFMTKQMVLSFLALLIFCVPAMAVNDESLGSPITQYPEKPPEMDRDLIRVIGQVANFYDRVGMADYANKIRRQLWDGVFVLTPPSEMKQDQGQFSNGKILINKDNVSDTLNFLSKGGKAGFDRLVSLSATIYHENLHADQPDSTFVAGAIEKKLDNDNTRIEQEVWEKSFAIQSQWIDTLIKQRESARTDAERDEIQKWLDAAIKGWNDYAAEISSHLDTKTGELRDTQWKGPGGISGTMAKGSQSESELWRKFRAWKAGLVKGGGTTQGTAQPISEQEILDTICRCSSSCSARGFYSTTPVKESSPSCEDPSSGPCVCSGWGCMRSVMSPACIVRTHQETKGQALSVSEVVQFIDKYQVKKNQTQDPVTIPPIVRKGEALQMSINIPGKAPEKWLWRSDDGKTFQATRLTPGSGPATETIKLQAPSLGHLVFERSSNGGTILGMRDLMNGGFVGGIADGLPAGTTISAYMAPDPGPATAVTPSVPSAPPPVNVPVSAPPAAGATPTPAPNASQPFSIGVVYSAEAQEAQGAKTGKIWPAEMKITSINESTGDFTGELTWTSLNCIHRIKGQVTGGDVSFKEIEAIRPGAAHLSVTYTMTVMQDKIQGKYYDPTDNSSGTMIIFLSVGSKAAISVWKCDGRKLWI